MRLLFILPEYLPHPGGGIATFYKELLPNFVRLGHQVEVVVGSAYTQGNGADEIDGVKIRSLKPELFLKYKHSFGKFEIFPELQAHLASAWAMWEQVDQGKGFDIVETTDWGLGFMPWILQPSDLPVVTQLHGSIGQIDYLDPIHGTELQGDIIRLIENNLLKKSAHLQTYSLKNQKHWQERLEREVEYMPPAFGVSEGHGASDDFHGTDGGLVGARVQFWKGPVVLCEAMRLLGENALKVAWVGRDTVYQRREISMSQYLGKTFPEIWGKSVTHLGEKRHQEMLKLQRKARFGIIPSIWDVFNFTCVEFMSQGRPVICSEGAGAADLVQPNENGLRVPGSDAKALASAILQMAETGAAAIGQMGDGARETIRQRLNPVTIAKQKLQRYFEIKEIRIRETEPDEGLRHFLMPGSSQDKLPATLDHLPLKRLSAYVAGRGLKKIGLR